MSNDNYTNTDANDKGKSTDNDTNANLKFWQFRVHLRGGPTIIMEAGWSPGEVHPYYSMVIFGIISDIKHLINP